jgi:hypothetical protein
VLFDNALNACYEATLSLTDRQIINWTYVPGAQPIEGLRPVVDRLSQLRTDIKPLDFARW